MWLSLGDSLLECLLCQTIMMTVTESMLSDYQHELLNKWGGGKFIKCKKVIPNLCAKEKYVLHYRNLKFYISQGLIITKFHRAIKFKQSAWMASYIQFNTDLQAKATSKSFGEDFFKLMSIAVFGKTMENLRKRINIELARGKEKDKQLRLVTGLGYISQNM